MNDIVFTDKENRPSEDAVKTELGNLYKEYQSILNDITDHTLEWKYPGKKYGWLLKAQKKRKALFWLTPLHRAYKIGFIVREYEREALLQSTITEEISGKIEDAEKYPEGYGFSMVVTKVTQSASIRTLIHTIKTLRTKK